MSNPTSDLRAPATPGLTERCAELENALKGLEAMYTYAWGVVGGGMMMMDSSLERFEAAHKEARRVLGVELMEVDDDGNLTPEHDQVRSLQARIAVLQSELAEKVEKRPARTEPTHNFAIIRDRNYDGEGLSLWTWNGENYTGADGDCLDRDPDGTLDGFTVEWLTDYQLEQRINADATDAARYRWLRDHGDFSVRDLFGSWSPHLNDGLDVAIDAAIAATVRSKETGVQK